MKPTLKKQRIVVVRGGRSSEREISLESGHHVEKALLSRGHDVYGMDQDEFLKFCLENPKKVDVVFIALHGKWGEDGTIQGFLELLGIPYTGSGVLASALAMDKPMAKRVFQSFGVHTPPWVELHERINSEDFLVESLQRFGFPVVIKPAVGGSTVGVSIVRERAMLKAAFNGAFKEDHRIFFEEYIPGRELTVGILGGRNPFALPVLEIEIVGEGFYDYENKYTPGRSRHLVPAPLDQALSQKAQEMALKAHQALNCKGFSRVDLRLNPKNELYVLEVNTIPGFTSLSLLPDAARAAGICFEDLVELIVQWALDL